MRLFILLICLGINAYAQHTPLPHGMVFGEKPDTAIVLAASQVEKLMGKKPRISTTIKGKVINVKKEKGGWFELDAGTGKIILAHFKNYDVILPQGLEGRTVIIEGIAFRQFTPANRLSQRSDTAKTTGGTRKKDNVILAFEVSGLIVYK